MRRVTINKPVAKTSTTRRQQQEDAAERRDDRPEVRKDIRRTWWPDE
ncbi:hypothetical protein ACFRU3_16840 [Streptomyces sp. NPDC056910]